MGSRLHRRRASLFVLAAVLVIFSLFFVWDPEPSFRPSATIEVSDEALRIHREALVVDLHADSLLWPRDLTLDAQGGHVDFPRMRRGGLDAVGFTNATAFFGLAGLKAFHDRWPPATWFSPWERLRFQLRKMRAWVDAGEVALATNAAALRAHHEAGRVSVFHGIEGAHAVGDDVSRVEEVAALGVVFISPVHLSDNAYGGSSSGSDRGLSALGRDLVEAMNRAGVMLDLAHASPATFDDAIALTELPPLVSHAGVRAVHDSWRNLTDRQIRAVAERGGVIGIMLAPPALSEPSLAEALEHIEHVIDVAGEDAVAIGSDFDGYVQTPIDAEGIPQLTERMLRRGFSETRIKKVLGGNVIALLSRLEGHGEERVAQPLANPPA